MMRGEIYRVHRGNARDTKTHRLFVIVSRKTLIYSNFSTVICAPIYSSSDGLATQVSLDIADGLLKNCSIHCDELMSLPKTLLTHFIASLTPQKNTELDLALTYALELDESL